MWRRWRDNSRRGAASGGTPCRFETRRRGIVTALADPRLRKVGCSATLLLVIGGIASNAMWPRREAPEQAAPASPERYPNPYKGPAPADVTRLLDGLVRGNRLAGGFSVRGVSPPEGGHVIVDVERGDVGFRVWITRKDKESVRPPASTERYALYVVQPRPSADAVTDEMRRAVLGDLKRRLAKTEANVSVPAGL